MNAARSSRPVKQLGVALGIAFVVGITGGLLTEIGPWYLSLTKPAWQPPDWLFGPAWTLIFGLSAVAAVYAWRGSVTDGDRRLIVGLFALNVFFNILWTVLFFKLKHPDWALIEVAFLSASVLVLIRALYRFSARASWLLVPYISWVTFAALLNNKIVQLNPLANGG